MSKRIPLTEQVVALREQVAAAQKEAETAKQYKTYAESNAAEARKAAEQARAEVEQIHLILDTLTTAPERKTKSRDQWGSESDVERSVITRLAGFFASRSA